MMRKGAKVWGLIVVLIVVGSCFSLAVGSDEAESYIKTSAYIGQDGSLFNTTQEPNEVTNLSWVDRIHNKIHFDVKISENETGVTDITYDNVSILRKSDITLLDANNNRIEDSLELKVSNVSVPKVDVIVLYNRSVDLAAIGYSSIDAEIKYVYSVINATAISIPCNRLYELPKIQNVKMVYEDHEVHAYLDSSVPVIKADTARTAYNVTGSNVTIAVIDTGIDDAHESLDDMDDNPATSDPKVIGFKDFVNFYPDPYDDHGHGTHCAGIAAGTGGSSVYKGVAPGAKLVGVKVLNAWGSGSESTVIAGIDWTVQNKDDYGIRAISMSLGRDYNNDGSTPMALACDAAVDAGIVVSVAAGNAGMWGSKTVGDPACAKKIITVGAIDDDMDIASFSSRGPTADGRIKPEVCAVGVDVTSADANTGNGYVPHSGTSMSTPHVAGVAALMLEYNPNLAPLEVREILMDTAVDRGRAGPDNDYGWGVVDAISALLLSLPQEHDIKVSDLQAPDYVKPNDTALVNATVCNIGMSTETNITVELIVNGTLVNNTMIPVIENGTNTSVYFTWSTPSIEGMYNLTVYVAPVQGENITINNQKTKRVSVTSAKPIALFKDRDPWGYASNEEVLLKYGLPYTVFTSSDMGDVNLSEYGKIVIASQQPYSFYFKIEQNRPWFEAYISKGSIFELHGAEWSSDDWSGLIMPGCFTSMFDLSNDVTVNMPNHMILNDPNVITAAELDWWNYATHGWLTNFSIKPITIITQEPTKNPCLVEFPYGDGYVVATMQTLEWAYAHEYSPFLENVILYLPVRQEHDILVGMTVPEVVKFNETNTIGANVWNIGLSDETNVAINFTVDGVSLNSKTIPLIQNGTDTRVSFNWTPTAVGWYNVSVYAIPVPGEDCVVNNLATRYVEVPKAVLTDVYADYGVDLDGDGLYDYLAIAVGVNVAEAGHYYLYGDLETLKEFYITDASNDTYLSVGKQNITLLFNGIDIRRVDLNGPYTLCDLELRDNYWNTLDKRLKAYNTSFYNSKEFQLPKAMFTDVYNDTGVDTDNDGYYNYLSIDIGVNVSESGYYYWYGELYDKYGDSIAYEGNSSYLENGTQIIGLKFDGFKIRKHKVNGPYYLKYLRLYDDDYVQQDSRHDAYTTAPYSYTEFQPPAAEFNDIYSDYGEDDEDEDELYNYLVINVGVNVRDAGDYQVSGSLYENGTYNYIDDDSNTTYLSEGNQTVLLRFDGIRIRQNEYNGTYDLKYVYLYNATYTYPVPPVVPPTPVPTPVPQLEKSEATATEDTNNFTVLYGEEFDYRGYAYTTKDYNWTDFQKPPAEFAPGFNDYGLDTNNNTLYDYLVIEKEIEVREAGNYELYGSLRAPSGKWIDSDSSYTYLDVGLHNVALKFYGPSIYLSGESGNFNVYMDLYDRDNGRWLDSTTDKTKAYNYIDFERPTAEFNNIYSDYGIDTDGDGLYNYLTIDIGVNVTNGGNYIVEGRLDDSLGGYIGWRSNYTYLNTGNQTVRLDFNGITIRMHGFNGTYNLKYLRLYDSNCNQLDYIYDAYTTSYYNYTDFQPPGAEFNEVYADYGEDTDDDGLNNSLVIEVGVNVTKAGRYQIGGNLYHNGTWNSVAWAYNTSSISVGIQTVQLRFDGITLRRTRYNGTFDLRYLSLYNTTDWTQQDYRYYAYTTSYYNWTEFQKPPARFNDAYSDYGLDIDNNGFHDYLTIDVGVNVSKAGYYYVSGELYNSSGWYVDWVSNYTTLNAGNQTVQLRFNGVRIWQSRTNGTFDLRYLGLYNASDGSQLDYRYYAYTTKYYNYTDWRPPAVFMLGISDYGLDTDGNGLYDYLVVEKQVNVTTAGNYELDGYLVNNSGYWVDSNYNFTYLSTGVHNLTLKFSGYKIYNSNSTGNFTVYTDLYGYSTSGLSASFGSEKIEKSFVENKSIIEPRLAEIKDANTSSQNIKPLAVNSQQLVGESTWRWLDSAWDITSYYSYTQFEPPIPDAYEPDDDYSLANYISVNGTKQTHDFHVPGDHDWLKFNALGGSSYIIETSELGPESDTYLYLYKTDGTTEITHDDDSGVGLASKIIWNCSISGTYFVMVRHYSLSAFGPETRYNISVTVKEAPPNGPFNIIRNQTIPTQIVLIGQDLDFNSSVGWPGKPVMIFRVVEGDIVNVYVPDSNNRYYNVNWPTTGDYYVNYDPGTGNFDAQLAIADPIMDLDLKVGTISVSSIIRGTPLRIDLITNLDANDLVDLRVIDPNGTLLKTNPADPTQNFDDIKLSKVMEYGSMDNSKQINTSDWDIGTYLFSLRTESEHARGLDMSSAMKALTVSLTENIFDTSSPANPYPSIPGTHNGSIKLNQTINVSKIYTYPCLGTGGHTEYARIWNSTWDGAEAHWNGYVGDWCNISFDETFTLVVNETYDYTIRTGSYPQIHHTSALQTASGWINCTQFTDANGKTYNDWIPAIRLWS
jgi:subtilisin family serine protease